jgi:hypothetical protein
VWGATPRGPEELVSEARISIHAPVWGATAKTYNQFIELL